MAGLLVLSLLLAGCSGLSPSPGAAEPATVESTTPTSTTETTATPTTSTTETMPAYGTEFLSVSELNESEAMAFDASERVAFENHSAECKEVVEEAVECDCSVTLDGEFSFHNEKRVKVVRYEGGYYYLRVAIV
ncbi:hypothetical protein [Haladaptatus halobius]|uniref:hypothetical protein n=1 Tax=Haladaptatus halobius TaxID=2884875 RepID=UPI001D0B07FE|nr:hypothetical protein [Haladaptatus halobius]